MNESSQHPTTSDISAFMRDIGYMWSNDAQVYYDFDFQLISDRSAKRLYRYLVGNNPLTKPLREDKLDKTHTLTREVNKN